ncbi:MAG: response regulator transcription factor [Thermoanaerobaculia bacterium]|nr:response regulator transcription factor [Thermoanaerobaculia bacterium]
MSGDESIERGRGADADAGVLHVSIVTDDRLFADGILHLIEYEPGFDVMLDEAGFDSPGAGPALTLLDSRMPGAIERCRAFVRARRSPVIFVAAPDDDDWAADAIEAGARGILTRNSCGGDLILALRAVSGGGIWAPRRVICLLLDRLCDVPSTSAVHGRRLEQRLSTREREIARCAVRGLSNKELAVQLAISEATVKVHLTNIFRKLGVHGRSALAAAWYDSSARDGEPAFRQPLPPAPSGPSSIASSSVSGLLRKS